MSGSGGSGGGVYSGPAEDSPCASITIEAPLASPNAAVAVRVGDVLTVRVDTTLAVVAVCVTKRGEIAGSLVYGEVRRLIRCVDSGHDYVAEVTSINGGRRMVQVRHA